MLMGSWGKFVFNKTFLELHCRTVLQDSPKQQKQIGNNLKKAKRSKQA